MEFVGKTRIETYHAKAVTSTSAHFVRVYYGWWSFSFRLDEGDAGRSHMDLRESAEAQAHALLLLDDDDFQLSWRSIFSHYTKVGQHTKQSLLQKSSSKGTKK